MRSGFQGICRGGLSPLPPLGKFQEQSLVQKNLSPELGMVYSPKGPLPLS